MKKLIVILLILALVSCLSVCAFAAGYEDASQEPELTGLWICLGCGFVIATGVVIFLVGQLKTVRSKRGASDYVCPGSLDLRLRSDIYLYENVTRVERPKNNSR